MNPIIISCVLFLAFFGVVMIYSASYYSADLSYDDGFYYARKQLIGVILGIIALIICFNIDFNRLQKYGFIALIISIIILALVFIPWLGVTNYGATRWIGIFGLTIQPSELAKFAFVLFCAGYLAKNRDYVHKFKTLVPILLAGLMLCGLIILEPNLSITICVGLTMVFMLFIGGIRKKHLGYLSVPLLSALPILIISEPYRIKRLLAFLDPFSSAQNEGFQLVQSLYSLSAGGLFGVGLFNSRQKYLFLPFSESDFIYSIIGEELGLFGCLFIIIIFGILIIEGIRIAMRAQNRFGAYLASGIVFVIAIQVIINMAVVTGCIPPTGLPLPFISYGGTAILVFMSAIGILLNIDKQSREYKQKKWCIK
ncbi:MAG: putative lipid II flippase FtsW [Bacilli bacterium]